MIKKPQVPAQIHPSDPSWIQTNEIPAIARPGLATWEQMQRQQQQRAPVTPIPSNWHDDLPKPVYKNWGMPKERKPINLERVATFIGFAVMSIFMLVFFAFMFIFLIEALMQFALKK